MRKLLSVMVLLIVGLLTMSIATALTENNLVWNTVRVNGDTVNDGDTLAVEEGQTIDVRVGLSARNLNATLSGAQDIEVEARISGYEYSNREALEDSTHVFDLSNGTTKYVTLSINLPKRLEQDSYTLRLRVLDRNTPALEKNLNLRIEPTRHGIDISDVAFSPSMTIKAGRSLLASVLLQNYGDRDERNVKVTVAVPALGISASEFVDAVQTDNHNVNYEDVPEMFLPIPANAREGDYEVRVTAEYEEFETVTKTYTIHVLANEAFQQQPERLVMAVGPERQTASQGTSATFGIALTNAGSTSKAYLLSATTGSDWATVSLSEGLVVLAPGQNKVVYAEVKVAPTATVGEHIASVEIKSGSDVLETVTLKTNVAAPVVAAAATPVATTDNNVNLRNGLEIALIILVVVLIIIGLIIGFSRMRKDNDEEKTYY